MGRAMTMNKGSAPEHTKRNIKNKPCGKVRLLETFKRHLEVEDARQHSLDMMSRSENCIFVSRREEK